MLIPFSSSASGDTKWIWWGDSLTAGAGGEGVTAPRILSSLLKSDVFNAGIGGESSREISARANGTPAQLKVIKHVKSYSDKTMVYEVSSNVNILRQGQNGIKGKIDKIDATLLFDVNKKTYFLKIKKKLMLNSNLVFITQLGEIFKGSNSIIWAGRNNTFEPSQVLEDLNSMTNRIVKYNLKARILVLSIINGDTEGKGTLAYEGIASLNKQLQESFGTKYFDIRSCLINKGLEYAGLKSTKIDLSDQLNDLVPTSLRSDSIHLNKSGYLAAGKCVYYEIRKG